MPKPLPAQTGSLKTAADVGTDTAEIYAISPEMLYRVLQRKTWEETARGVWGDSDHGNMPGQWEKMQRIIREHGGAVFQTGRDGYFDVKVHGGVSEGGAMAPYGTLSTERVASMHREALRAQEMLKWVVQPLSFLSKHHKDFINGPVDDVMDQAFREIAPHVVKAVGEAEIDADVDEFHDGAIRGKWDYDRELLSDPPRRETEDFIEGYTWGFQHPDMVGTRELPARVKKQVVEDAIQEFRHKVTEKVVLKALRSVWGRVNPLETFRTIIRMTKKHGWKLGLFIASVEILETFVMPAVLIHITGNAALAVTGQLPLSEILYAIIFPIMFRGKAVDTFTPDGHLDWYEALYGMVRVAERTPQSNKLQATMAVFEDVVGNAARATGHLGWTRKVLSPEQQQKMVVDLNGSARNLLPLLTFKFENPAQEAGYKKYLNRMRNYRKMVKSFTVVKDWDDVVAVCDKISTKSKGVWEKVREYGREVQGVLDTVDTEVQGSFAVGKFRVILMSSANGVWDNEMLERTRHVLHKTSQLMGKHGMGKLAAGNVWAYSSPSIPGRSSVVAWYRMADDALCLACGSGWWMRRSMDDILKTLVHELGHRAYFKILGGSGRKAWADFFELSQEVPDVQGMISRWERYVEGAGSDLEEFRRGHLQRYLPIVKKRDAKEKYDSYRGYPTKTSISGLQALKDKANSIKVFMHPVTVYSASNEAELFAEVFSHYIVYGPQAIAPVVQDQFKRALPMARLGKEKIPGGLSEGKDTSDLDPKEMAMGVKVEMEHTGDPALAKEIASDHLVEISDYYTRLKKMEAEAEKPGKKAAAQNGKSTGNRKSVGFFIPLPKELAAQYPSRAPVDKSAPHVTLLYVGEVTAAREKEFLAVVTKVMASEPGPIKAAIGGVDYFRQPDKDQSVAIQTIKFSRDVGEMKKRLRGALEDADFVVEDSFPGAYRSHTTLAYLDGTDSVYEGPVPVGSWEFDSVPVWGLPSNHDIPLGEWTQEAPVNRTAALVEAWGSILCREV